VVQEVIIGLLLPIPTFNLAILILICLAFIRPQTIIVTVVAPYVVLLDNHTTNRTWRNERALIFRL